MVIDCTLSNLMVPGFLDVVPEFGTKKPDGQSITARENNRNVMLPFTRQRPYMVTEDSTTTPIEAHSGFAISVSGVTLTLGNGAFTGCEAAVFNVSASTAMLSVNGNSITVLSGEKVELTWNGSQWLYPPLITRSAEGLTNWHKGENLLDVLRVNSVAEAMDALRARCNDEGDPDFSDLRVGDYLDLPSITIGTNTYPWIDSYQNLRLLLSGFNQYKGAGDTENTKNHVLFTFKNCVLTRRMNASDSNSGGYLSSEMRTFLEGDFKAGLQAALGGNYIQPMRRLMSKKGTWAWETDTVFLPTEREVWGCEVWGEVVYDGGFQGQFPIFRESCEYLLKRYNGARQWWWEGSPSASSAANFCYVYSSVTAHYSSAGSVGGVAPAFCVA